MKIKFSKGGIPASVLSSAIQEGQKRRTPRQSQSAYTRLMDALTEIQKEGWTDTFLLLRSPAELEQLIQLGKRAQAMRTKNEGEES